MRRYFSVIFIFLFGCCGFVGDPSLEPSVEITGFSWYNDKISGVVSNVDTCNYIVTIYIQVDGTWWVKPLGAKPQTDIGFTGYFSNYWVTVSTDRMADKVRVYVVQRDQNLFMNFPPKEYIAIDEVSR